jgi:hypothetical protein
MRSALFGKTTVGIVVSPEPEETKRKDLRRRPETTETTAAATRSLGPSSSSWIRRNNSHKNHQALEEDGRRRTIQLPHHPRSTARSTTPVSVPPELEDDSWRRPGIQLRRQLLRQDNIKNSNNSQHPLRADCPLSRYVQVSEKVRGIWFSLCRSWWIGFLLSVVTGKKRACVGVGEGYLPIQRRLICLVLLSGVTPQPVTLP